MAWGIAFLALSPSVWMMTPQLTAQYGHVLRVSVVRSIFSVFACAYSGATSKPNADRLAPPMIVVWMNALLEISMDTLPRLPARTQCMRQRGGTRVRGDFAAERAMSGCATFPGHMPAAQPVITTAHS